MQHMKLPELTIKGSGVTFFRCVICIVVVVLFSTACDRIFGTSVGTIVEQIDNTLNGLKSQSGQWQNKLDELEKTLNHDFGEQSRTALNQVKAISEQMQRGLGTEARCSAATISKMASLSLEQLIHDIKKDGKRVNGDPEVCQILPEFVDLSNNQSQTLVIDGAFFFSSQKPGISVLPREGAAMLVKDDVLSRQSDWTMIVDLSELRRRGALLSTTKRILISYPNQQRVFEVPVQQPPQCDDRIQNGMETDVDCGGANCARCGTGKMCKVDSDCDGLACVSGKCGIYNLATLSAERDFGGGFGGNSPKLVQCPGSYVASGIKVAAGNYPNGIQLFCSSLSADGKLGPEHVLSDQAGAPGGNADYSSSCADGKVVRGLKGRAGGFVTQMQSECSYVREIAQKFEGPSTEYGALIAPSGEGGPVEAQCPTGQVVVGLRAKGGRWMDHLWIECASVDRALPH